MKFAERGVECALDELVSIRVLQPADRMDIESLLNPKKKLCRALDKTTDEVIYQAVLDAQWPGGHRKMDSGMAI
jgi:hypothetical protein